MTLHRSSVLLLQTIVISFLTYPITLAQDSGRARLLQDLRRTMAALASARAAGDGHTWSRYVTEGFLVIHPDGRMHDRAEEIAELNGSKPTAVLVREAERFQWYGEHTVVYASDFISTRGQPVRAIEVWIHQDSVWKIAAAQVTRVGE